MYPTTIERPDFSAPAAYKEIWLAGGCFWGTEEYISRISGVITTATGYANGNIAFPSYEQVCSGATGFAETIYVAYEPTSISLVFLLEVYYQSINPLSLNQQGSDIGSQYRTGIYYTDPDDVGIIEKSIEQLEQKLKEKVAIEHQELMNFYLAETYHQRYLQKNPHGYCHISPELFSYADTAKEYTLPNQETLQKNLTPIQYQVTQENATEAPFTNEYDTEFRQGIYVDITTGEPLFLSSDKYNSGCGWPAFSKPITENLITEFFDTSCGHIRTEVRSTLGNAHLGHVFDDGPKKSGGLRYCINSASLRFIPLENMSKEGYQAYVSLIENAHSN